MERWSGGLSSKRRNISAKCVITVFSKGRLTSLNVSRYVVIKPHSTYTTQLVKSILFVCPFPNYCIGSS